MTRRSILIVTVAVIVAAGILLLIASQQRNDDSTGSRGRTDSADGALTQAGELTEYAGKLDLDELEDSSFVSILVPNAEGRPTSYMVDAAKPAAGSIIDAVRDAKRLDPDDPTAAQATTSTVAPPNGDDPLPSAITFVLVSRQTVTFVLDLEAGLLYRDGQAFRPKGDLRGLVASATGAGG